MGTFVDITGEKFGKWTVLNRAGYKGKQISWDCICDCGSIRSVAGNRLRSGTAQSCGCLSKRYFNKKNRVDSRLSIYRMLYNRYIKSAEKRGLEFNLDWEYFQSLLNDNCYYCGRGPHPLKKVRYILYAVNGIDRLHSNEGYYKENVVTACTDCNYMKLIMPVNLFFEQVKKIYNHVLRGEFLLKKVENKLSKSAVCVIYNLLAQRARRRDLHFDMTLDLFGERVGNTCIYCGAEPSCKIKFRPNELYTGLDRLDSSQGYTDDNVVPCCKICNFMKMTLSYEEFLRHILTIYKHRGLYGKI